MNFYVFFERERYNSNELLASKGHYIFCRLFTLSSLQQCLAWVLAMACHCLLAPARLPLYAIFRRLPLDMPVPGQRTIDIFLRHFFLCASTSSMAFLSFSFCLFLIVFLLYP